MAKKTKSAPAVESPAGGAPAAPATDPMAKARAARAAGGGAQDGDIFTVVPEAKRTDEQKKVKLAPQAQVIGNAITAAGAKGISRKDLNAAMGDGVSGALKTKQPVGRIVTYYQKTLQDAGICTITKASAPVAAPAKE